MCPFAICFLCLHFGFPDYETSWFFFCVLFDEETLSITVSPFIFIISCVLCLKIVGMAPGFRFVLPTLSVLNLNVLMVYPVPMLRGHRSTCAFPELDLENENMNVSTRFSTGVRATKGLTTWHFTFI